jgi:exodeoxyribonuclease VII large subunit
VTTAVRELDDAEDVDVIVITRGGGSVEDLLPFSNEALVRAVAACRTPVVSAIGHEQDAPLLDFVADLRASTPTDAAKRIVPSLAEQQALISALQTRTGVVMRHLLEGEQQRLDHRRTRATTLIRSRLESAAQDVAHLRARVRALSPAATLDRGYAIVLLDDGSIVREAAAVPVGARIDVRLAQGRLTARREPDDD